MKRLNVFFVLSLILLLLVLIFSPYKYDDVLQKKTIKYQISIEVEKDKLYKYLGDSDHARDWSLFVNHITVLNTSDAKDGEVGSVRRCFRTAEENGMTWDEEILEVDPSNKRVLSCFNLQNFPMQTTGIVTEQLYTTNTNGNSLLEFNVSFKDKGIWDKFKIMLGAWYIEYLFKRNMENIKFICEKLDSDGKL